MLSRWFDVADPVREMTSLRDAVDRLMEQAVVRPGTSLVSGRGLLTPLMNVVEHGNRYVVHAYLPGVRPENVDLSVRQGTLTLKGRFQAPRSEQNKQVTWLLQELPDSEFARSITLPKQIDSEHVEAHFDQGILTITLPVAAHEQPRSIAIKAGNGEQTVSAGEPKRPELDSANSR